MDNSESQETIGTRHRAKINKTNTIQKSKIRAT